MSPTLRSSLRLTVGSGWAAKMRSQRPTPLKGRTRRRSCAARLILRRRSTSEDWRVGLVDRFAEDGCTVTPDALARLIELGEGHPRATMLVAQQTHDAAIADGTHVVDSGWWPSGWHQPWLPTGSLTNL